MLESGRVAGALVAGLTGSVTPGLMFSYFVYASAAATLGGFDSLGGAVIGGLSSVMLGIGSALAFLVTPVGLVLLGLAGLTAAFFTLTETGRETFEVVDTTSNKFSLAAWQL